MVRRLTTTTYPTRYAAFAFPGHLVLLVGDEHGRVWPVGLQDQPFASWVATGGRELAVFSEPTRNRDLPSCSDGVHLEIVSQTTSLGGSLGGVVVQLQVSAPTFSRTQWGRTLRAPSLVEALPLAEALITQARTWVADRVKRESLLVTPSGRRFALLETPNGTELLRMMSATPVAVCRDGEVTVLDGFALGPPNQEGPILAALVENTPSTSSPGSQP